jgi:hypothetical protein
MFISRIRLRLLERHSVLNTWIVPAPSPGNFDIARSIIVTIRKRRSSSRRRARCQEKLQN